MTENTEIEIDLLKILKACLKKVWIIILVAAIAGGGMFVYRNSTYVPVYSATTTLYAHVDSDSLQNPLTESRNLVSTCRAMLKTRMTLDAVSDIAGVEISSSQLSGMITVSAVNQSELFKVTVTGLNADILVPLANAIGKVLPEHIAMVNSINNVGVIDEALEANVSNVNTAMTDAVSAAVVGAFLVFLVIAGLYIVKEFKAARRKESR